MANSRILTNIDKIETGQPHSAGVMRTILEDLSDMIYISDTVPPNPYAGQLWIDTSSGAGILKKYNGSSWDTELENWADAPGNPAYSGSDNFKVDGDLRTIYYVGRCIRYKDTAGGDTWQYTIIPNNYYNAENDKTFVYVADSGLDEGLNSFQLANFSAGQIEFSISGNFSVMTGITHFSSGGEAGKIVNIQAYCLVSPTGADAIFDVNYSTDLGTWTTLFTTQSHRPVIYKDSKWSDYRIVPDVVDFLGTWYFRCDCDQIGSTVAGADGLIVIYYIPKNRL